MTEFERKNLEEFNRMSAEKQRKLLNWIESNCVQRKSMNINHSSYGLKHIAEEGIHEYVSNEELIGAMIKSGYKLKQVSALNAIFNISERSNAFR